MQANEQFERAMHLRGMRKSLILAVGLVPTSDMSISDIDIGQRFRFTKAKQKELFLKLLCSGLCP